MRQGLPYLKNLVQPFEPPLTSHHSPELHCFFSFSAPSLSATALRLLPCRTNLFCNFLSSLLLVRWVGFAYNQTSEPKQSNFKHPLNMHVLGA
jgi:hypothetical protein